MCELLEAYVHKGHAGLKAEKEAALDKKNAKLAAKEASETATVLVVLVTHASVPPAIAARFDRHVDIRKPGAKRFSARATTEWCRIDRASRRPKRIGEDVLDTFALHGLALD